MTRAMGVVAAEDPGGVTDTVAERGHDVSVPVGTSEYW
jgi:hypothetical protein